MCSLGVLCQTVHHTHTSLDCGLVGFVHHHFREPALSVLCVFPRSDLVEKNAMLRTKAMREKEEQRERRKYNYTLLRIRLPDGNLLQGQSLLFKIISEQYKMSQQPNKTKP